jgi:hypothetical protein
MAAWPVVIADLLLSGSDGGVRSDEIAREALRRMPQNIRREKKLRIKAIK